MAKKRPQVALVYDFDGTLSPGNMQEFGFIQATGKTKEEFWEKNRKFAVGKDANGILTYMYLMLDEAKKNNISLTRESFQNFGKDVELFRGVKQWFSFINEYGASIGLGHQALHQLLGIEGDDRGHTHRPRIREHLCLLVSL